MKIKKVNQVISSVSPLSLKNTEDSKPAKVVIAILNFIKNHLITNTGDVKTLNYRNPLHWYSLVSIGWEAYKAIRSVFDND